MYALQHPESIYVDFHSHETAYAEGHEARAEGQRQVEELHIEVNQAKKARQVEAITGTSTSYSCKPGPGPCLLHARNEEREPNCPER